MKEKITELEAEAVALREEAERLRRNTDRIESARSTLARKDSLLRSQKTQLDKVKGELKELSEATTDSQKESERRIRNLQRQLAEAEQRRIEAERECELMRRRVAASSAPQPVRLGEYPQATSSGGVGLYSSGRSSKPVVSYVLDNEVTNIPQPHMESQPINIPGESTVSHSSNSNLPQSLGLRAGDLDDVMAAIGSVTGGLSKPKSSIERTDLSIGSGSASGSLPVDASSSVSVAGSTGGDSDLSIERRLKGLARAAFESPQKKKGGDN